MNLDDMINTESVSPDGAAVLRRIARSRRSFLVHAMPQGAGKTTLVEAILAETDPDVPRNEFLGTHQEVASLSAASTPGYLLVAEIGHRGRPGYLAGADVPPVFDLVAAGYSLASSLHADSVDEVFEVLAANGVPAAVAASVPYLIKVRVIRNETRTHVRRVVDEIHQITTDDRGEPSAALLYRWDEQPASTSDAWNEEPERHHRGRRRG